MTFYNKIQGQVSEIKDTFNYKDEGTAFGHFIIKECFKKIVDFGFDGLDFDDFVHKHLVDMAYDLGNDVIFTNKEGNNILIFQAKFSENNLLNTEEIKKNKRFIDWILGLSKESLTPNPKLKKVIDEEISLVLNEKNINEKNYSLTVFYIDNQFTDKIKTDIRALFNNYYDQKIDLEVKFYDYKELEEIYDDVEIPTSDVEVQIVKEEFFSKDLIYYDDDGSETPLNTMIVTIKANSIKKIIEKHKELIFALNVRYYKGENEINSKIKEEYSKGKKSNFWILNNGINAICEGFEIINNETLRIKNMQIVNGGQTTKTLTRIVNDLPDEVQILMKLTKVIDKTKISKISKNIAIASNSQNAITSRDLHSGERIQRKIFEKLDTINIFFDKKDGEWATVDKKKYRNPISKNPMYLKISNAEMGKAYMSFFLQIPISTKGRDKLVFSELYYEDIFNSKKDENYQFLKLLFSYKLSEKINTFKFANEGKYEILQNNYINDVLLSLTALYFLEKRTRLLKQTPIELKDNINKINFETFLSKSDKYDLCLNNNFNEFVLEIINGLQYILDVKKEAKKQSGEEWMLKDTNNWLKKDGTYKEILEKIILKLR
jgi:hypothetical protein